MTPGDRVHPPAANMPREPSELHALLADAPIMRLIGLAGQAVGHSFRRTFAEEDGLSPGAAGVLMTLASGVGRGLDSGEPGRATHTELAQRCLITPATLTGIVSTLEKSGYVDRDRDRADRRVVWLVLTEAGAQRAGQMRARVAAANAELKKLLTPELEEAMRGFLITVIENDLALVQEAPDLSRTDAGPPAASPSPVPQHASGRPRC